MDYDEIKKSMQLSQNFFKQLGIASQLSEIAKTQEVWKKNLSGINMLTEIAKSFKQQEISNRIHLSGLETIAKAIASLPKFEIPTTAFDAINSIAKQHEQLFGNRRSITDALKLHNSAFTQVNNLQFALNGISGQMAAIAAAQKQWDLLDDFENISKQAIGITNNITTDIALTEEESIRFEKLIETILAFLKRNKKFATNALLFLSVIVNLMALYDFVKPKPELATKEDLAKFERKILQTIQIKLKEEKEYRTTNRVCKVMLKPKRKTLVLGILPLDFNVIVLRSYHKWIYVSYINPIDNLPQTGWVMKKYLIKP